MNTTKLTIEEFNEIKKSLLNFIQEVEQLPLEMDGLEEELEQKYFELQNTLLSYDLSDIPFESWEDLEINSLDDKPVDFSKTRANIDFDIIDVLTKANFKNCNVKNVHKFYGRDEDSFDQSVIDNNPGAFLSNAFSKEFKKKYYDFELTIEDLLPLDFSQLVELKQKDFVSRCKELDTWAQVLLGADKMLELYRYSKTDYQEVCRFLDDMKDHKYRVSWALGVGREFIDYLISCNDVSEYKNICYSFFRDQLIVSDIPININEFSEEFINSNQDLFLINCDIPEDLRERYYKKILTIDDVKENLEVFRNIPIDSFITGFTDAFRNMFGLGKLQIILEKHLDVFEFLNTFGNCYNFREFYNKDLEFEEAFNSAVKKYLLEYFEIPKRVDASGNAFYDLPTWVQSMNFNVVDRYENIEEFKNYTDNTLLLDKAQSRIIEVFGLENIIEFERKTGFFSYPNGAAQMLGAFVHFFRISKFKPKKIVKNYEDFIDALAQCLEEMRNNKMFGLYPDYGFLEGELREKYPYMFINENVPPELKKAFYVNEITASFLQEHKEYIPYLLDVNLEYALNGKYEAPFHEQKDSIVKYYVENYGQEEFLNFICQYGELAEDLSGSYATSLSKEEFDKSLRNRIYHRIITNPYLSYVQLQPTEDNLGVPEFFSEFPNIFIDYNAIPIKNETLKREFYDRFYWRKVTFHDISLHPGLIEFLENKNLKLAFHEYVNIFPHTNLSVPPTVLCNENNNILNLIDIIGNKKFLELCSKYGSYLGYLKSCKFDANLTFEELCKEIENIIYINCKNGTLKYSDSDVPQFLKEEHGELFLGSDAPEELAMVFYGRLGIDTNLSFDLLKKHKDWLPYLEGKSIVTPFLRGRSFSRKSKIEQYFELFGRETAIKLGMQKSAIVNAMIDADGVGLMKSWYDKLGQKFIPDHVVMLNIPVSETDKFLASGTKWSQLMKIKSFADTAESRDAMLKLAYSFGVFDGDTIGFKKLKELLTDIPRKIPAYFSRRIDEINLYKNATSIRNSNYKKSETYNLLVETLKEEGFALESDENVMSQIYRLNEDKSYTLTLNPQSYPKSTVIIRDLLAGFPDSCVLSPRKAHQLFGGFDIKYDKHFREFLLANLNQILHNSEYASFIGSMQKRFEEIRIINSNRTLTLDLAVSFLQSSAYDNVSIGNERVAEIAAIVGYSQNDFDTLQRIFDYGKQRTFSSIPRIEGTVDTYSYEMLRLDDPLAMAVGSLSNCCQRLGDFAESCMEHSMVDKNGRVFVIKDDKGNIIAQSWVWRNKDVICFDNIEIPDKAFDRAQKTELGRKGLVTAVFELYKRAAYELVIEDEKVFKELLKSGKITQEQYDGLRLGKVTVGMGYNDIASTLERNAKLDDGPLSRPLPFDEPVPLSRGLYAVDSETQYILEEREDRKEYDGESLFVHNDTYLEYTDETFKEKHLLSFQKLELITKGSFYDSKISTSDSQKIVTELANNYKLNPDTTKIIMNPNFAIIYDVNGPTLTIGDLLYNTKVNSTSQPMDISNVVLMQIRTALDQISKNKNVNISLLNGKQQDMYNKALELSTEIDLERGIGHGK